MVQRSGSPCVQFDCPLLKLTRKNVMALVLRFVLLQALYSVWCVAQQRTGDGRVILNLGYFATYAGSDFVSSGEDAWEGSRRRQSLRVREC